MMAMVPMSIPPAAPTPTEILPLAPTPDANTSGSSPIIMVSEVIKIGRRRSLAALMAAWVMLAPSFLAMVAYSVSKTAVLASSPISMISPIWR